MQDFKKNVIVGTAGHIDHGKSSLVEALTGTHPDRLEEEKRRGITIDLGFAFLETEAARFGFVDVPGHEKFVSNMLAGAAGIDLVVLVIAADESIKPQTREHFDICRLLGVQKGMIALTKSDLVNEETLTIRRLEIEEFVRGTFLQGAAILPVSAKTRRGVDELKKELQRLAEQIPGKNAGGIFRLPIDRSFSIKGFGAVVTGTLQSGSVSPGDEVELFPSGKRLRVRGVQSGGKQVERATAGQRTAVNLAGIEYTGLHRGMSLAVPGRLRVTQRVGVRLELLPSAPSLKQRAQVHFHSGTVATIADVTLHEAMSLRAGETCLAHLHLRENMPLLPGDRFIVRQFSPVTTIGGGVVLDVCPKRPRAKDTGRVAYLNALEQGGNDTQLQAIVARAEKEISLTEVAQLTGWTDTEIAAAMKQGIASSQLKAVGTIGQALLPKQNFEELKQKLFAAVSVFQKANPLLPGMSREAAQKQLGRNAGAASFQTSLAELLSEKRLQTEGEFLRVAGTGVSLQSDEIRAREEIVQAFANAGLTVPPVQEVLGQLKVEKSRSEILLQMLLREKVLVRINAELTFHANALLGLKQTMAEFKKAKNERISVPVFKEITGVSRKYAIPLLEYLDRERVTRRAGDERVIL